MKPVMPLGDFLVAYLKRVGVERLFGIPGDLVLNLFLRLGKPRGLPIVTLSHEPGVGFAADGYARSTRRLGVLCVTYGAGGHNMVNPIAGAFSEKVPLLVLSGGPGEEDRKLGVLIHHQAKEIESQFRIYQELTCAAAVLDDPRTAAEEVDRVVRAIHHHHRPGYLEIHRDAVERPIPVPAHLRRWDGTFPPRRADRARVAEAVRETAAWLNRAKRPVIIAGVEVQRFGVRKELVALVERLGVPCLTTVLAKGVFPMDQPQHMGIHIGPLSHPAIRRRVAAADLVLYLGAFLTDVDLGNQPLTVARHRSIWAMDDRVEVSFHSYADVPLADFLRGLLKIPLRAHRERVAYHDNLPAPRGGGGRITVSEVLQEVNRFLRGRRDYLVTADSGDAIFAGLEVRMSGMATYLAQGYYASMGFAVPGALGAQMGTGLRPLVLCGDGAFQMTGYEIAHAPRHGLTPVVILLNNGGWGIFHPLATRPDLLALPSWRYAALARLWGGAGYEAGTAAALREALEAADRERRFVIIEVPIAPGDLSPLARRYFTARRGPRRPR